MFDFHEKRKIKSILYSKVVVGVLLTISVLLSISVYNRFVAAEEMQDKLDSRRAALQNLEERAEMLRAKVEYLDNERGVEEELRNRFDIAREGEQVVILVNKPNENKSTVGENSSDTEYAQEPEESFFNFLKFW